MRRALIAVLIVGLLVGIRAPDGVYAQVEPGTPASVVGEGLDPYTQAAPRQLLGQLARVVGELDALPPRPTPQEVKDATVRRRMLELRLLMDFNAFAYDPEIAGTYRDALDEAYEDMGMYQDLAVTERLSDEAPSPELVEQRLVKMVVSLAPLRSPEIREAMATFFAAPSDAPRQLGPKQLPRLWALAEITPSAGYDSVGNLAMLGQNVLRNLHAQGLFVADIFDPVQEERFHDVRKAVRSVLVLTDMFPATRDGTADVRAPITRLVSVYGQVNDRVIAFHAAEATGRGVEERASDLRESFADAQAQQQQVIDEGSIDQLIERLERVQQAHRR